MTIEELRAKLLVILERNRRGETDRMSDEVEASNLLLAYIRDEEVNRIFRELDEVWYS